MKASDLGIHLIHDVPSSRIGYPVKAFEFMACELPFLMSDIGNKRKLFNNVCEFIKPRDTKNIKSKIDYLMNNKEVRKKLGQRGRKKIIENYNLELEIKSLVKLYDVVLNKKNLI